MNGGNADGRDFLPMDIPTAISKTRLFEFARVYRLGVANSLGDTYDPTRRSLSKLWRRCVSEITKYADD